MVFNPAINEQQQHKKIFWDRFLFDSDLADFFSLYDWNIISALFMLNYYTLTKVYRHATKDFQHIPL